MPCSYKKDGSGSWGNGYVKPLLFFHKEPGMRSWALGSFSLSSLLFQVKLSHCAFFLSGCCHGGKLMGHCGRVSVCLGACGNRVHEMERNSFIFLISYVHIASLSFVCYVAMRRDFLC